MYPNYIWYTKRPTSLLFVVPENLSLIQTHVKLLRSAYQAFDHIGQEILSFQEVQSVKL